MAGTSQSSAVAVFDTGDLLRYSQYMWTPKTATRLIMSSNEMVDLMLDCSVTPLPINSVHKVLFDYYFPGAHKIRLHLGDNETVVMHMSPPVRECFVGWMYTGTVNWRAEAEELDELEVVARSLNGGALQRSIAESRAVYHTPSVAPEKERAPSARTGLANDLQGTPKSAGEHQGIHGSPGNFQKRTQGNPLPPSNNAPQNSPQGLTKQSKRTLIPQSQDPEPTSIPGMNKDAPNTFPSTFKKRLLALPSVKELKPPDWLDTGRMRKGIKYLALPDQIIAAAMAWDADQYFITKSLFFKQYKESLQAGRVRKSRNEWIKKTEVAASGKMTQKKASRLFEMWEVLGWLDNSHYLEEMNVTGYNAAASTAVENDRMEGLLGDGSGMRKRVNTIKPWSIEEEKLCREILGQILAEPGFASRRERNTECSRRMAERGFERSADSIEGQMRKLDKRKRKRAAGDDA